MTAFLSAAAPSFAGTYPVVACSGAGAGRADAWASVRTAPDGQFDVAVNCPSGAPDPYGSLQNGLAVADTINAWDEGRPDGSYAEWRFTAPSGTAIVAASITRDIGNRDEWTPYGRIDAVDQAGESCVPAMGEAFCRIQGTRQFSGLNAETIAYGVRCVVAPYCAHGATLRTVWALVLSATVTLDDRQAPTVSAVDATGLADGQWWNRTGGISFSGQDNTGIRRRAVVVGGVVRAVVDAPAAAAGGCRDVGVGEAYSFVRPCADARGVNGVKTVSVDPCSWGDGVHAVRGRVTDTGGLEALSSTSTTVRVDCAAPALTLEAPPPEVLEGEPVEPLVTGSDARSGLARVEVEVRVDGGGWRAHDAPLVAEAGRSYEFRARALDKAGNWTGWEESAGTLGVAPPAPPAPPAAVLPVERTGTVEAERDLPLAPPVEQLREGVVEPAGEQRQAPASAAGLRITRVLTRARGVTVITGVADRGLRTAATVVVRVGRRAVRRRVAVAGGRWRIRIPGRATAVTVTTQATATHAAGTARWRAPRTKTRAALAQDPA